MRCVGERWYVLCVACNGIGLTNCWNQIKMLSKVTDALTNKHVYYFDTIFHNGNCNSFFLFFFTISCSLFRITVCPKLTGCSRPRLLHYGTSNVSLFFLIRQWFETNSKQIKFWERYLWKKNCYFFLIKVWVYFINEEWQNKSKEHGIITSSLWLEIIVLFPNLAQIPAWHRKNSDKQSGRRKTNVECNKVKKLHKLLSRWPSAAN